jgi:hypothetical protein
MLSWKTGQVMVAVKAEVSEHFAVHPQLDGLGWGISHIPTGFKIMSDIKTEAVAKRIAEKIRGLDWNFETADQLPLATKKRMTQIQNELREIASCETL